jgi:branched-chain amino acid aminotransferase
MDITMSRQQLKSVVNSLLNRNNAQDCGIRLTLTGGYSSDGYQLSAPNLIISQHLFSLPSKEQYDKGISLMLHEHQRQLPQVKTIDYLMAIWLQPELKKHEADDILYHRDGLISECPRANIFMVSGNGRLVTPREHILKGITRHHILALAKEVCEVEERAIDWNELKNAKEVFITSSTKKILPVCRINNITYPSQRPVSKALSLLFDRMEADYAVDNAQETKQSVKEIPH